MWIPLRKLVDAHGDSFFPETSAKLVARCIEASPSICNGQYAKEVLEGIIR